MCGVIAAVGRQALPQVEAGLAAMSHRGIRSRVEYGEGWAVGHVRLPIVGVGEGNDQPASIGRWVVGFVGEVLDFREREPGADCDLPLVLRTWEQEGPPGFTVFDGFWAVVAVDRRDGSLHCLVDYLSQKPMYVREDLYSASVASEPDALARLGRVRPDEVYLASVVKWGYCPEPWRTPYAGIRRVCPGEYVVLGAAGGGGSRWSRPDVLRPLRTSEQDLKVEVEGAVRRRVLSSDVPVACLVSGGLDSSIVYTLASRHGDVRPYHVENGEWGDCLKVAPNATRLELPSAVDLRRCLSYHQEPVDLGSLEPQVALSDAVGVAGGERVCLTGDGADELFGGYGRASRYDSQASDVWHELVCWHLPRLDRVMMRNRVEVRSPFLARRVAGAALGLSRKSRVDKSVLRRVFRGDLPPGTADVPKRALRVRAVESDREFRSRTLVDLFRERFREGGDHRA